jgi:hypothetical protein
VDFWSPFDAKKALINGVVELKVYAQTLQHREAVLSVQTTLSEADFNPLIVWQR